MIAGTAIDKKGSMGIIRDLEYGIRQLTRAPGFTLAAVLTLAIGIAAYTTIFTVADGVLLRPLPYDQPESLHSRRAVS